VTEFVVECRSESGAGPVPARFGWPGRMRRVAEILDAWEGDDHRYFRLRDDDDAIYILRHDRRTGAWEIHFFREEPDQRS
jgi:hypothetical protein